MLKKLAIVVSAAALIVGVPTAAQADPTGEPFTLICDNGQTYNIVTFSNGTWSPGLLTDGNEVVRPVALDVTGTFTPTGGVPEVVFEENSARTLGPRQRPPTARSTSPPPKRAGRSQSRARSLSWWGSTTYERGRWRHPTRFLRHRPECACVT